ncbi:MAG: hypothetical protein ACYC27_14690 [Armatimonadota bacterium]
MEIKSEQFNPDTSKVDNDSFVEKFGEPSYQFGLAARRPFERMALLGLLFAGGQQNLDLVDTNRNIFTRRNLSMPMCETVTRTNNRLPIYLRSIGSAFGSNLPDFEGVPHTYEQDDVEAAHLATRVLKWRDREDKERGKRQLEINWALCTGNAWRFTWWNTKGGKKGMKEGDVQTDVVNLFNVVIDPYSVDMDIPRWLIHTDVRHVDEVKALYGVDVEPEDVSEVMRDLDRLAMNIVGSAESSRETKKDQVLLHRMYVPPSERYPDGYCWIWAGKKFLRGHELQAGQWPWSRFGWLPLAGRLYDVGLVEWLLADQKQLNLMLSQLQEVANRQMRGDILTVGSQKITEIVIDPKSGRKQIILPPGIQKYDILKYDQIWSNAANLYEWLMGDMDAKAGQSRPTLGQTLDKEARVGELQMSIERDLGMLQWHIEEFSEHICEVDSQKLALTAEYTANVRMIQLFGKSETNAIPFFTGADLLDTSDVIAVPVPRLSPAMKRQLILQADEAGWLGPYESPDHQLKSRMLLKYMGLSEIEEEIAQVYGPFDDLKFMVSDLSKISQEVLMMQAQQALEMAVNPPAPEMPGESLAAPTSSG